VRRSSAGCKGGAWGATREPDRPTWTPLPGLALFVWFGAMNARRPTATPRIASSSHKAATSCPSVGRVMPSSMPASERMKLSRACCGSKATAAFTCASCASVNVNTVCFLPLKRRHGTNTTNKTTAGRAWRGSLSRGSLSHLFAQHERKLHARAAPRRFTPPRSAKKTDACFIVDKHGQALACVYFEDEPGRRAAAKLLTRDEAQRIAVNIAKLPELLTKP
jgi:hypothetical protein